MVTNHNQSAWDLFWPIDKCFLVKKMSTQTVSNNIWVLPVPEKVKNGQKMPILACFETSNTTQRLFYFTADLFNFVFIYDGLEWGELHLERVTIIVLYSYEGVLRYRRCLFLMFNVESNVRRKKMDFLNFVMLCKKVFK